MQYSQSQSKYRIFTILKKPSHERAMQTADFHPRWNTATYEPS